MKVLTDNRGPVTNMITNSGVSEKLGDVDENCTALILGFC